MDILLELVLSSAIGDFLKINFYYFLNEREFIFIMGLLTLSLSVLARNNKAMFAQVLLFINFWLHMLFEISILLFLSDVEKVQVWSFTLFIFLVLIQVLSFVLILYELKEKIRVETPR